jgi:hypothetical protein
MRNCLKRIKVERICELCAILVKHDNELLMEKFELFKFVEAFEGLTNY